MEKGRKWHLTFHLLITALYVSAIDNLIQLRKLFKYILKYLIIKHSGVIVGTDYTNHSSHRLEDFSISVFCMILTSTKIFILYFVIVLQDIDSLQYRVV